MYNRTLFTVRWRYNKQLNCNDGTPTQSISSVTTRPDSTATCSRPRSMKSWKYTSPYLTPAAMPDTPIRNLFIARCRWLPTTSPSRTETESRPHSHLAQTPVR